MIYYHSLPFVIFASVFATVLLVGLTIFFKDEFNKLEDIALFLLSSFFVVLIIFAFTSTMDAVEKKSTVMVQVVQTKQETLGFLNQKIIFNIRPRLTNFYNGQIITMFNLEGFDMFNIKNTSTYSFN
jgi:hypothetical protein